jgi:NADH:ubiquinone reductase (H+-translocating)
MRPKVVIVGAGFAGLSALLSLKDADVDITLLSQNPFFEYLPSLHLLLSDPNLKESLVLDLETHYKGFFRQGVVTKVSSSHVHTENQKFPYDYLVLAAGSNTNDFHNRSFQRYALPVKTVAQALQAAERLQTAKSVAVIGAGYTGVEIASIIAEDTSKTIHVIDADEHVLSTTNPRAQKVAERYLQKHHVIFRLGQRVKECKKDSVVLEDGELIRCDVCLLASGIVPNVLVRGALQSDLSVKGKKNVFRVGDASDSGLLATGHNAMLQGRHAAKNIKRLVAGQSTKPFSEPKVTLLGIALGHHWGVIPLGKSSINSRAVGFLKWLVQKRILFEFKYKVRLPL